MFKILITLIFFINVAFSQESSENIQKKYYEFCRTDLISIERIEEFPFFPTEELCSIKKCFRGISHEKINSVIYKRVIELAQKNFNDGIILFLIEGKGSVQLADLKNENVEDDNSFIYISVDDFINAEEITKARKLYNKETKKLLRKK